MLLSANTRAHSQYLSSIWRGYKELQEVGGWAALVFAGMGLYRFCKYRTSFTESSMKVLRSMRHRFEVAADTIHPHWRQMLSIIGIYSEQVYHGHPHDWVVGTNQDPVPLASTYLQRIPDFLFEHLEASVIDPAVWDQIDPRRVQVDLQNDEGHCFCERCNKLQSESTDNRCCCFPDLFGNTRRRHCPVQVFCTDDGRNNGLISCSVWHFSLKIVFY